MLLLLSLCPSDIVPAHETDKLLICNSKKCKSKAAAAVPCGFCAKCIIVVAKRTKTAQRQQCRQTIHLDVKKIQQVGIEGMQEHMCITQLAPIIILFGKEFNKESINSPGRQEMRRLVYSLTLCVESRNKICRTNSIPFFIVITSPKRYHFPNCKQARTLSDSPWRASRIKVPSLNLKKNTRCNKFIRTHRCKKKSPRLMLSYRRKTVTMISRASIHAHRFYCDIKRRVGTC